MLASTLCFTYVIKYICTKQAALHFLWLYRNLYNFRHIEKIVQHVPPQKGQQLGTGNMNNLMQNYVSDQSNTYEDLLSSYNWVKKVQDYSTYTFRFISPIVRINQSTFKKVSSPIHGNIDYKYDTPTKFFPFEILHPSFLSFSLLLSVPFL